MTLQEAEQAVIRAAIELRDRLYSADIDHDDTGEQLGGICLTVDALEALRSTLAAWRPKVGDSVRLKRGWPGITFKIERISDAALFKYHLDASDHANAIFELEPVPEQGEPVVKSTP